MPETRQTQRNRDVNTPETQRDRVTREVLEILENQPNGIRYTNLFQRILEKIPSINHNTLTGALGYCLQQNPQIKKLERGLWLLERFISFENRADETEEILAGTPVESAFYEPFANYLMQNLEECTKAIPLGGNRFGSQWGTPDVFGIYKFSEAEVVRPPIEIISAEIKTDTNQLITAFGQACAYKIFSHKVYLVVPKKAREVDIGRIESLCARFGIGLILFDRNNSQNPEWEIRTRAIKSEPDYFYVNEYLQRLGDERNLLF